ncbi:MAG: glutamate synthase large subunit [Candidatus Aceula meridiana]|nr:glutamate synthase large subunit [Candidatus Aceula meridiana]
MKDLLYPKKQGLYDPAFEKDSCGIGFIANIKGNRSHKIIQDGLKILENLTHRGATGSDPLTGDGAGLLIQIPDEFFRKESASFNIDLPEEGAYGAGIVFLPTDGKSQKICEEWLEEIIKEEGQILLGWRKVPTDSSKIGKIACSVEPEFKQVFIGKGKQVRDNQDFERKLYVIRKRMEVKMRESEILQKNYFYICSLSSKTIVYKGQLMAEQVSVFYKDLNDPAMTSCLAMVHSRYSTNTFPTWALAHPYRMMVHNGEINTLRGNINWMHAREMQFYSELFGKDTKKILPIITPHASDSATFDNVLEMLMLCGRSLPHAIMMMIPEAWSGHEGMSEEKKAFYEYHSALMEPWDGPASIAFSDGRYIGAILDRNGLRPSRYLVTKDNMVIMASEAGVLPIEPANVLMKGRLQPGRMFLVDTQEGRIIDDEEIKKSYTSKNPYQKWIQEQSVDIETLPKPWQAKGLDEKTLLERQKVFGYTLEDLKIVLYPMVTDGKEATGSMGEDTPLAVLSRKPRLLFTYFKQLFAQVTNPPVDAIREEIIMAEDVLLGAEGDLLKETPEHIRRLKLKRPILLNEDLEKIRQLNKKGLSSVTLSILLKKDRGPQSIEKELEKLFAQADKAIKHKHTIIILSDRGVNKSHVSSPSLLACAALHHHLVKQGTRTKASIVLETGEAREMHHFATLIGYGANAINPYLALETIENEFNKGRYPEDLTLEILLENFLKSTRKGLFKITSKMGISTTQSYCGAQIFEAVGLGQELIDKYFTATPSRIGGVDVETVVKEMFLRHDAAYPEDDLPDNFLEDGGHYAWRKGGEHHQLNPDAIASLHYAVKNDKYDFYKKFADLINSQETNLATIRGLLKFKKGNSIPIKEVEPVSEIVKRFATGAMSYGSISKEAHETMAIAMNRLKAFSNTGEGGENPERFKPLPNGDSRCSRIKQVAQGRFGVTIEYLTNADQLQIKMAQGAKPGEGGQLPGHKVSQEIANTRYTTKGVGLISPPPHHDIYSIEDLAQLIHDLKNANPSADVSVKLVSEVGVGTVAAGVSKGKADHLLISGYGGGTGASPQTSIKNAGLPLELGIAETQQVLVMNDLRGRIRVQADSQLRTGRDVAIMAMLGADEFGFATIALVTMGCVMLRKCHLNACSVGIATQDPELRKNFTGKPEHVVNYFMFVAQECREIMAEIGIKTFNEMIGRVDLLETQEVIGHWKLKGIDLTNVLYKPQVPKEVKTFHCNTQTHGLEKALDREIIKLASKALEKKQPVKLDLPIQNTNRTVGTTLSHEIAKRYGLAGLPEDTIKINFKGSAGQSFGAFLANGVTFRLEGDSNDYMGKGLSGGRIVVVPPKAATFVPEENIIVGNVILYGAIKGEVFIRGIAGERFCVRNSGVHAVVEGIGDHGCEYMTGGRVVVLGPTGRNFAAGMSGGLAYIWDKNKEFKNQCNLGMVDLVDADDTADIAELKKLIEKHFTQTQSTVAKGILDNWETTVSQFVKVYPHDYRRVLEEAKGIVEKQVQEEEIENGSD